MEIKEMEDNGTIDYYLELKKYINHFLNNNYPLSQEDLRSILENNPTANVKKRQETGVILNDTLEGILENIAKRNSENFASYTVQDFEREVFEQKQKLLAVLWEKQHQKEQLPSEKIRQNNDTGKKINQNEQEDER